MSVIYYLVL